MLQSVRSPVCSILEHLGMETEADDLDKFCNLEHIKEVFTNAFSEELDVVTLVHGDPWSSNMMFKVSPLIQSHTTRWHRNRKR